LLLAAQVRVQHRIRPQESLTHQLARRLAEFRRGKGVSQAQSGLATQKGCSPLLS